MKAIDVIARALRLARVIASDEAPSAEDARDSLDVLNSLFAEWRGSGIMIPDYKANTVGDDLTIERADKEAIAYQLALRITPEFGIGLSPEFKQAMDESFSRLRLRYFQPGCSNLSELPVPTGCDGGFSIEEG